jgi:copper(I)-binding protein
MLNLRHAGRLAACALTLSCLSLAAHARDYAFGEIKITHPWSRPTPPSALSAIGYLTIANRGASPDRLIGGATPAADKLEIHKMSMAGGVMTMRPVEGGLVIPPGGSVALAPDGYHLMLIGPKHPFKAGERIPIELRFEHAGTVKLDLDVEAPADSGASMPGMAMPGGHMDMH